MFFMFKLNIIIIFNLFNQSDINFQGKVARNSKLMGKSS